MKLTKRCMALLRLLASARWLTTSQIHARFFPEARTDTASQRLLKLSKAGYLVSFRQSRMSESLFTLGPEGKRALEQSSANNIVLERRVPKQLEHLRGVNDVRIAAEREESLRFFFSYWELPGLKWTYPIIPDALFALGGKTFAVEYDRGCEGLRFFVRSKVTVYRQGLLELPLAAVLVVADRRARMESLARAIGSGGFLYTTIDQVRKQGLTAPIFVEDVAGEAVSLVPKVPFQPPLTRGEEMYGQEVWNQGVGLNREGPLKERAHA